MRTLIVGGGRGCRSILGLTQGSFLKEFHMDVAGVADLNPEALGMKLASEMGLRTFTNIKTAVDELRPEVIIELTGEEGVFEEVVKLAEPGTKFIDHSIARLFWDMMSAHEQSRKRYDELQALEERLAREKKFLQSVFDGLSDPAVVLDDEMNIILANEKFYNYVGLTPDKIIGKKCWEALEDTRIQCDEYDLEAIYHEIAQTRKPHVKVRSEPPPEEAHWEITRSPIFDESGEIGYILSSWHKITERVMLKREVESSEQRFKSFINSAQDWISIKDLDGRYVIANPVTAAAFEMKPKDFIGKKPSEILDPGLAETIRKHDNEVIATKKYRQYEEIIPVHGQDRHFQTIRFPLADYRGDTIGVCTIARDITKEIYLQDRLVKSEKLAAIGKLAAGVAHEINNPLTGILAFAEDIRDDAEDEYLKEDCEVIIRETLRCRDIVKNLLDFARQDTPKLKKITLNEIVHNAVALIGRLPQFRNVEIKLNTDPDPPEVNGDPMQLQQVALNFMLNAADAMKYKGRIIISTKNDKKNDSCILEIEDNGPGIPENLVDKIFDPFFSTKGTSGLGLAVSWGIVERHRGRVEVDMADPEGAIFRIILPAYKDK